MAVARQVQVATGEDGFVAVQRDVIVDPELGIAAEVEKVVVAVDVGGGKVAVMEQNRVKGVTALPSVSCKAHKTIYYYTGTTINITIHLHHVSHLRSLSRQRELSVPPAGIRPPHATSSKTLV